MGVCSDLGDSFLFTCTHGFPFERAHILKLFSLGRVVISSENSKSHLANTAGKVSDYNRGNHFQSHDTWSLGVANEMLEQKCAKKNVKHYCIKRKSIEMGCNFLRQKLRRRNAHRSCVYLNTVSVRSRST
jgi:hypothetical protein